MSSHLPALTDILKNSRHHPQADLMNRIVQHAAIGEIQKRILCLCLTSASLQDIYNDVRRISRGSDNGVDTNIRKTLSSIPHDLHLPVDVMTRLGFRHYQGQFYFLPSIYEKNKAEFKDADTWPESERTVFNVALDHMAAGTRAESKVNLSTLRHVSHLLSGQGIEDYRGIATASDWRSAVFFIEQTGLMSRLEASTQEKITEISEQANQCVPISDPVSAKPDRYKTSSGVSLAFVKGVSDQVPKPVEPKRPMSERPVESGPNGTNEPIKSYFSPEVMASAKALHRSGEISELSYQYFLAASRMKQPTVATLAERFSTTPKNILLRYSHVKTCLKQMDVDIPRLG
ncbi:MAG: hypothetical protein J0L77_00745 [Alphaproteobacteria bacterium]|nr:hypothetical protein [Alphaproteobacteria bacterium]